MSTGEIKFKNKYKIGSSRLPGYDYTQNGMYFVTICTKGRQEYFGKIENGRIILNETGEIVWEELLRTPMVRPNITLDAWIIMPNHLHAIIEIINQPHRVETPRRGVSTAGYGKSKHGGFNPDWKSNSLGSIINQFKSVCTKRIWKSGSHTFSWQSRFYDHIIRKDESLQKIREYITNNPEMWERDRNNEGNLWM